MLHDFTMFLRMKSSEKRKRRKKNLASNVGNSAENPPGVNYDFPQGGGAHTCFRLREVSNPAMELTDAIEIHFINVVKW